MSASGRVVGYTGDDFEHRVRRNEAHPRICFGEGDDAGDDGAGGDDAAKKKKADDEAKQYSKADLERIVKDRLKKRDREYAELQAAKEKSDATLAELSARVEELEEGGSDKDGGKDVQKELATLRREVKKLTDANALLTKEKDLATKSLGETTERYKRTRVDNMLRDGLISAKAHKDGLDAAVELLRLRGNATIDDEDQLSVTIDGIPYNDAKEASAAFLKKHSYLAEGMRSQGDGHPRPGSGNGAGAPLTDKQMEGMGVSGLLTAGLAQPVKR